MLSSLKQANKGVRRLGWIAFVLVELAIVYFAIGTVLDSWSTYNGDIVNMISGKGLNGYTEWTMILWGLLWAFFASILLWCSVLAVYRIIAWVYDDFKP